MILFILSLIAYFGLHSILANLKVKAFLIPRFIPQKYYRLFFNTVSTVLLLPIYLIYSKVNSFFLFDQALISKLGIGICILGFILLLIALSQYNLSEFIGVQQLNSNKKVEPVQLKTSGFNSIVRHPLYFSTIILAWGFFLYQPSLLVLMLVLIINGYLYVGTKLEEEKLILEFGKAYLDYKKEVGMLLPFIGKG